MKGIRLLKDEEIKMEMRPHPFAFSGNYFLAIYFMISGILLTMYWNRILGYLASTLGFLQSLVGGVLPIMIFWGIILIPVVLVGLFRITLRTPLLMILYALAVTGLTYYYELPNITYPSALILSGVLVILATEIDRRLYRYYITNLRLILTKRGKTTRETMYDKLSDITVEKNVLGHIFNIGNIIFITQSGLGLGSDFSAAMVGGGISTKTGPSVGAGVGGGRTVTVARARPTNCLYGVRKPEEVKHLLSEMMYEFSEIPVLKEILDELRKGKGKGSSDIQGEAGK